MASTFASFHWKDLIHFKLTIWKVDLFFTCLCKILILYIFSSLRVYNYNCYWIIKPPASPSLFRHQWKNRVSVIWLLAVCATSLAISLWTWMSSKPNSFLAQTLTVSSVSRWFLFTLHNNKRSQQCSLIKYLNIILTGCWTCNTKLCGLTRLQEQVKAACRSSVRSYTNNLQSIHIFKLDQAGQWVRLMTYEAIKSVLCY